MLIYPAYFVDKGGDLKPEYKVTKESPPMFFVHANDDKGNDYNDVFVGHGDDLRTREDNRG